MLTALTLSRRETGVALAVCISMSERTTDEDLRMATVSRVRYSSIPYHVRSFVLTYVLVRSFLTSYSRVTRIVCSCRHDQKKFKVHLLQESALLGRTVGALIDIFFINYDTLKSRVPISFTLFI